MPNIKVYESPVQGFRATETGVEATAQAGRRANQAFAEAANSTRQTAQSLQHVGQETRELGSETAAVGKTFSGDLESGVKYAGGVAVDMLDHQQISAGAVAYTKMNERMTAAWNKMSNEADPNDPTVAQNFREKILEPELETFKNSFLTEKSQDWAERRAEALRDHMSVKATADMASMAGRAAEMNVRKMSNNMSNTAMLDPSSIPQLLKDVDATIGGTIDSSPNLRGPEGAKLRMQLTQAAKENIIKYGAIGAIQKSGNPEAVVDAFAKKYPDYVNGAELKMLGANARQQIRAARQDQMWSQHQQKLQEQDASDKAEVGVLQKLYSDDPQMASTVSSKAIVNDPTLNRVAKERLINVVNREMKPETDTRISNATFVDLAKDIRSGEIDNLDPLFAARSKPAGDEGGINRSDFNELRQMFIDRQTPDGSKLQKTTQQFINGVAPQIDKSNPLMGILDRTGKQQVYEFGQFVQSKVDEYRRAKKNPQDLFDPSKPDYLGKPEAISPFKKPLDLSIEESAANLGGPRKLQPLPQSEPPKPPADRKIDLGNPPMPGAVWSDKRNSWVIRDGGREIKVDVVPDVPK